MERQSSKFEQMNPNKPTLLFRAFEFKTEVNPDLYSIHRWNGHPIALSG